MNESQSRQIAERAKAVRPLLDLRERLAGSTWILFLVVWMGFFLMGGRLLGRLMPPPFAWASPIIAVMPLVVLAAWFRATRHRRLRESRAKMLCPRCRYTLREDGPDLWTTCDGTVRVCPECAYAVSDDVYAAAALPTVRARATRVIGGSRGAMTGSILVLVLYFGGLAALAIAIPASGHLWLWLAGLAVLQIIALVLALLLTSRMNRAINAWIAAWRAVPFCTNCDAALGEGARESALAVCAECGQRVSPPAALAEARRAAIR